MTSHKARIRAVRSGELDAEILNLWGKLDTLDIARRLRVPEAAVYNRLPALIHSRDARGSAA